MLIPWANYLVSLKFCFLLFNVNTRIVSASQSGFLLKKKKKALGAPPGTLSALRMRGVIVMGFVAVTIVFVITSWMFLDPLQPCGNRHFVVMLRVLPCTFCLLENYKKPLVIL